jgi:hypothetical protein
MIKPASRLPRHRPREGQPRIEPTEGGFDWRAGEMVVGPMRVKNETFVSAGNEEENADVRSIQDSAR